MRIEVAQADDVLMTLSRREIVTILNGLSALQASDIPARAEAAALLADFEAVAPAMLQAHGSG